ncbi:hypothetical protein BHS07_26765 [Myxococcus xanthus]|nr:hypothetical protein BHS07_26765 [Myxococcus xanthus]QDF06690.1 hypothetical protein BHS04_26350 [Myxococcus xanthus]
MERERFDADMKNRDVGGPLAGSPERSSRPVDSPRSPLRRLEPLERIKELRPRRGGDAPCCTWKGMK